MKKKKLNKLLKSKKVFWFFDNLVIIFLILQINEKFYL